MALPAFAEPDEMAEYLGIELADDEAGRAAITVRVASQRIRSYVGKDFVTDTDPAELVDPLPESLNIVAISLAARIWDNPTGEVQNTAGASTVIHGAKNGDPHQLTDSEKDMLADADIVGDSAPSGIGVIRTTKGDNVDGTYWATVQNGEPIPLYDGDGLGFSGLI